MDNDRGVFALEETARLGQHPSLRYRLLDDEAVALQMEAGEVLVLDQLGGRLLARVGDAGATVAELADWVACEYEVSRDDALRDLLVFAGELVAARVLVVLPGP